MTVFTSSLLLAGESQTGNLSTDGHSAWIAKSLKEIETIKADMTRADLLKVFTTEGGVSNRIHRRYIYRKCPYIKVDVEFEAVGNPDDKLTESPSDQIIKISKPFLEWTIID